MPVALEPRTGRTRLPTVAASAAGQGASNLSAPAQKTQLEWRHALTPTAAFWLFLATHVAVWTLTPLVCCPNAPLDLVEMVYWGREWQWGYPKHPPLVSWGAAAIVWLTGANTWGLYLAAQSAVAATFWCAWRLGCELLTPRAALLGVVALEGCFFFHFDGAVFNNNVGLYPLWALASLSLYWALKRQSLGYWIATGVWVGLGLLSKYSMGVLPLAAAALMTFNPTARAAWRKPGPYVALLVAGALFAPHVHWAIANDFPGLAYAQARTSGGDVFLGRVLGPISFALSQLLALSFVALIAWPALGLRWRLRAVEAGQRFERDFLLALTLGPFAILMLVSLVCNARFRGMHGSHLWPFAGLALFYFFESGVDRRRVLRSVALCTALGAGWLVAFVARVSAGPYLNGRPSREHFPGAQLSAEVSKLWEQRFGSRLAMVAGDDWFAGNVAFYAASAPRYYGGKGCTWLARDEVLRSGGVVIWDASRWSAKRIPGGRDRWPNAEICAPIVLKHLTGAKLPDLVVGIALAPPAPSQRRATPPAAPTPAVDIAPSHRFGSHMNLADTAEER